MIRRPPRSTLFPYPPLSRSSPEDECLRRELDDAVQRAIAELPSRCREVFVLRRRDALPYDQIAARPGGAGRTPPGIDRKSTRLNSSHSQISYAVFCLKKKNN